MSKFRFRLCDEDRAEFGGPEWVELDRSRLESARAAELERIERDTSQPISVVLDALNGQLTAVGVRALIWIAREHAGLKTPFRDFNIHTLKVDSDFIPDEKPAETDPLDSSSAGSEEPA